MVSMNLPNFPKSTSRLNGCFYSLESQVTLQEHSVTWDVDKASEPRVKKLLVGEVIL